MDPEIDTIDSTTDAPAANKPWLISEDVYCPQCDYNLRGLVSDRCPECGYEVSAMKTMESAIPWVHRKRIGWWRAYGQTMWMVMFRNVEFCNEIAKPVGFDHSQSYRWATVSLTWVPLAVFLTWSLWDTLRVIGILGGEGWLLPLGLSVLLALPLLILALVTGVPSYFFHPKHLPVSIQNRAIALSYYTSGPLALMMFPIVCAAFAVHFRPRTQFGPDVPFLFFAVPAVVLPIGVILPWWLDILHVAHRSLRRRTVTTTKLAIFIPIFWFGILLVVPFGISLLVLYVTAIVSGL